MSIAWLRERMEQWASHPAIVWHDHPYPYQDLLTRIQAWHTALNQHDVGPGEVVTIEGDYSPNAVSLLLTLIERNTIVVPLTHSVAAQREEFLGIAEVQVVVSFTDDDRWHIERRPVQVTNPLTRQLIDRQHPGLVLFSSGSTGKSKAALHDFIPLLEKFKVPRHRRVTLTFLLLDHIGGINTLFYTLANGGTVVSVPSRDPDVVCRAIETHRVQTLPTSPTFLNLLLISEAYRRYDLSSLELITYGTEVMPESTLHRIHALFPNVQLLQTYGLSELGILRSKSRDSNSLWVKVGGEGFETKIVDGVLWVRAKSAMLGYLNAPSPFDEEGWMNTQDVVEVDGEYIRILGRRSDIINVGGQKVYPAEVESVLLQMPNVKDVAVVGEPNPITGHIVTARFNLFEPEDPNEFKRRVRAFCRDRLAPYKIPVKIIITDSEQHSARFKKMRKSS
ncbi:MAG TPA: long-chain fatty acid--CoA ligase [Chloroflexus aurantiacus]|uniref:AMP-dependent synthetase and ligase n=1 Tax=Chloroflexus aurantiacus (strain ATCC 29366 / DSM 635 / J-10-fl) TaxID=324602 RepID=A9WC00_CHLAA|nr:MULTISPECIES: fatty acid--CoA ligase family protein [Chloroflexus]ABY36952.1 AMP-dependent synthetase and ligase [Chloroflexus aurantiacus J-10-fl]RMG47694.1 MAG: long-chain fatty acid--CoA ligase [Chloroflexota bacterium]GIV93282.1 MAG: AMP-dependent synthetase [Chloroflexus sp.]HBW67865.1 long-chain fatty acid--CoA ligase [Chloroflexus aurantiacus]